MGTYYIGADVHSNNTELTIEKNRTVVRRLSLPTRIPAIVEALEGFQGRKEMAIEESTMAGWLYRNLVDKVDKLVVSDPRRNKLIACDGDKDDKIDSAKLAMLLRGGYLRPVYHSLDADRLNLKHWVQLYDDRMVHSTRCINQIRARCRMEGVKVPRGVLRDEEKRQAWLDGLESARLAEMLSVLWIGYAATVHQCRAARRQVVGLARQYPIVDKWQELPGVGIIRAVTLLAYVDTPYRFSRKNRLWKYCGVGLERTASGKDRHGRPKPGRLKLNGRGNRRLKNVVLGAATSAIHQKSNVFKDYYERLLKDGVSKSNARHAVARKMLTVMWGMWKNDSRFDAGRC
jgi:transposase